MNAEQRAAVDEIKERHESRMLLSSPAAVASRLAEAVQDRRLLLSVIAELETELIDASKRCGEYATAAGSAEAELRLIGWQGGPDKVVAGFREENERLRKDNSRLESALAAARAELVETRKEREFLKTEFESAQEKIARSYGYASAPFAAGESVNGKTIRDVTPGSGVVEFIYRDQCQSGWKVKLVGGEHAWDSLWFTRAAVLAAVKQGG